MRDSVSRSGCFDIGRPPLSSPFSVWRFRVTLRGWLLFSKKNTFSGSFLRLRFSVFKEYEGVRESPGPPRTTSALAEIVKASALSSQQS